MSRAPSLCISEEAQEQRKSTNSSSSQSSEEPRHVGGHGVWDNASQEAHRKHQAKKLNCQQLLWDKHHMRQNLPKASCSPNQYSESHQHPWWPGSRAEWGHFIICFPLPNFPLHPQLPLLPADSSLIFLHFPPFCIPPSLPVPFLAQEREND